MDGNLTTNALHLLKLAFAEDLGDYGDITSEALGRKQSVADAKIIAKQDGALCGMEILPLAFDVVETQASISPHFRDGAILSTGDCVVELTGPAHQILIVERTILNFLGRLSGIATMTRKFVDAVAGTKTKILDTRKTTPGWRLLEKYAVFCGGGENHRIGLYDMFLVKENHIAQAGGITAAVQSCRNYMEKMNFEKKIEVETKSLTEVKEALDLSVDRIMLDNMSLEMMRENVELVAGKIELEASGNVNLENVRMIAETGVDYISVGALTHSPPVFDFSLLLKR